MSIVFIWVACILLCTHYFMYVLGEERAGIKWRKHLLREIERKTQEAREGARGIMVAIKNLEESKAKKLPVKTSTPRARKVAVKKK